MKLGQRFLAWVMVVLLVTAFISAFLNYDLWMRAIKEDLLLRGNAIGNIIESSIVNLMLVTRERSLIDRTIEKFSESDEIEAIFLSDSKGIVRSATAREYVGRGLPRYDKGKEGKEQGELLKEGNVYRWVRQISNRKDCHGCHSKDEKVLGHIMIDFNALGHEKRAHIIKVVVIALLSFLVIGLAVRYLFNDLIVSRLNNVEARVKKIKEGNYETAVRSLQEDEITALEDTFNDMSRAIRTREEEKDALFRVIERAKQEWQQTFDSITDMIHIYDGDLSIIKANRAFAGYFGLEPREVIGRKCVDLSDKDNLYSALNAEEALSVKDGQHSEEVYDPLTRRSFRSFTYPYFSPGSELIGAVNIARDITDEREREMKLIMNERLASLGQMASGIAHEINNPLASIGGCAEGLLKRLKKDNVDKGIFEQYLKIIEEEVSRCKKITSGMLNFVRDVSYERGSVDLKDLVQRTLEIIEVQGRMDKVSIVNEVPDGLPQVTGGVEELKQVIMTVVINALDAMNDEGTITLTAAHNDGGVTLNIHDTGPGIMPDQAKRIFDPFFTTRSDTGGIGLGLAIARKIVAEHDGDITVSSEGKGGATFHIYLPV